METSFLEKQKQYELGFRVVSRKLDGCQESLERLTDEKAELKKNLINALHELQVLSETKNILAIINDSNTSNTLNFVNSVINRVLGQMFPSDPMTISIEKSLYAQKYVHLTVKLTDSHGNVRDMKLQSGTGLKQVVSFLFRVCLIELRGGRRVLFADEILNGVHLEAKRIILEIMKIFASEGFQFVNIEHGGMTEYGRVYNIEKVGNKAEPVLVESVDEFNEEIYLEN